MKTSIRLAPLPLLLPFLALTGCTTAGPPESLSSRARAADAHRLEAHVPGLSIAWLEDGRVVETAALGTADADSGRPVTDKTIFEAASLSKPVTAYLAMILAERGELDLDAPLSRYAQPDPPVAEDSRLAGVTARHVLTHSSGLPNWRPRHWSPEPEPLVLGFDPGERFSYSGEGFVFLQRALEAITGREFRELAEGELLEPLEMSSTSFVWRPSYDALIALPHDLESRPEEKRRPEEAGAASSLHTTAGDYARFVAEVLSPTLLAPATIADMLHPWRLTPASWRASETADATGEHVAWGLGWALEQAGETTRSFWHWGDNGYFKAFVMASPRTGDGFVFFANSLHGLAISEALAVEALPGPHPAFDWLGITRYDSAAFEVPLALLGASDTEEAIARLGELAPRLADDERERVINRAGYELLWRERFDRAVAVLRWNAERHPDSANVWDSLAEAELGSGDLEAARVHYEKSLELDPGNDNAREKLREIAERMSD